MPYAKPPEDTRPAQALRAADFLEAHPGSTLKEINDACDVGSVSKLLSDMPGMGYGIDRGWRDVPCAGGSHSRRVRTYVLLHRPAPMRDLFSPE
ncbi:hypothetical protein [Paracidovorax wautersii]|uniref:hypothetical protein n=1 Tax=Paracidovorax wautersii TaxID=1177982 RepID=UPI0031D5CF0B